MFAQYVNCFFQIPGIIDHDYDEEFDEALAVIEDRELEPYEEHYRDNTVRDVVDTQFTVGGAIDKRGPARFAPILPGLSHTWRIRLTNKFDTTPLDGLVMKWSTHADNAPANEGKIPIADIPVAEAK